MDAHKALLHRLAVAVAATVAFLSLATFNRATPAEPSYPSAFEVHVTISTGPGTSSRTITIEYDAGACAPGAVIVRIDGVEVGTMGCGDTQSFALAPGRHTLTFPTHQGSHSIAMEISPDAPGLPAKLDCRRR